MGSMRAVLVDAERELVRRRKLGIDKKDELWDGVWHLVNPPEAWHERLNLDMVLVLGPRARDLGLEPFAGAGVIADLKKSFRVRISSTLGPGRSSRTASAARRSSSRSDRHGTRATRSCRSTPSGASPRC
jgi:hypothetical protein